VELTFITHGDLLSLHYLHPLYSWVIVLGGVYAFFRVLARDAWRAFAAIVRGLTTPPPDAATKDADEPKGS
jgi:hypothetical protein